MYNVGKPRPSARIILSQTPKNALAASEEEMQRRCPKTWTYLTLVPRGSVAAVGYRLLGPGQTGLYIRMFNIGE